MDPNYIKYGSALIKLIEECSEVQHALCKIERFGLDNYHPVTKESNRLWITEEIADLKFAIENFEKYMHIVPIGTSINKVET
jgi:hypothetical protein